MRICYLRRNCFSSLHCLHDCHLPGQSSAAASSAAELCPRNVQGLKGKKAPLQGDLRRPGLPASPRIASFHGRAATAPEGTGAGSAQPGGVHPQRVGGPGSGPGSSSPAANSVCTSEAQVTAAASAGSCLADPVQSAHPACDERPGRCHHAQAQQRTLHLAQCCCCY